MNKENMFKVLDSNVDSLTMGNLLVAWRHSHPEFNSKNLMIPVQSDMNTLLIDYLGMVKKQDDIQVRSIEKSEIPDTMTCSRNCKMVPIDAGLSDRSSMDNALKSYVAPNPFDEQIEMKIYSEVPYRCQIELIDIVGRTVITQYREIGSGSNQVQISTAGLPAGFYALKIKHESGLVETFQMIHATDH